MSNLDIAHATGAMTGARYLESLRDDRHVWFRGERITDVTKHPALEGVCRTLAGLYDLQHAETTRDTMTRKTADGARLSYSYVLPTTGDDLLQRRRNAEVWVERSFGMMGRYSDFCAAMTVGFHDAHDELEALQTGFGDHATRYHRYAEAHDLCLAHGLHDPGMDKALRPEQDPDRCLRIVKERDDGLVVRGARFSTLAAVSNEILLAPTYPLNEREADHAIWFALPVATPGVTLICRESYAQGRNTFDHPVSARFDEQDTIVVFDDVLVPWERVFLARAPAEAGRLFRSRVMTWAIHSSLTQTLGRMRLMLGTSHLMARTGGTGGRPNVQVELGELATYVQMLEGGLRAAELDHRMTAGGHCALGSSAHLRAFVAMISERLVSIMEHIGTSSLIFLPTKEDMQVPQLKPYIDLYGRGQDTSATDRVKLCKLAWELTGDSFGGRQQLYERLHSGDPAVVISNAYRQYDIARDVELVEALLALDDCEPPTSGSPD